MGFMLPVSQVFYTVEPLRLSLNLKVIKDIQFRDFNVHVGTESPQNYLSLFLLRQTNKIILVSR